MESYAQDSRSGNGGLMTFSRTDRSRRATSALMTSLTAVCTLLAVSTLVLILSYIAMRGIGALSFWVLVYPPRPVGEGGGIRKAIGCSAVLLLLFLAVCIPAGI